MSTIRAAPSILCSNTVNKIAPAPSAIEPIVTTSILQRQQQQQQSSATPGHQANIDSDTPARTTTANESVDSRRQHSDSTTHSKEEGHASNSTELTSDINLVASISCINCGTTTTPLWRRAPNGDTICNACGLYLKARHTYRPTTMKRNMQPKKHRQQSDCGSATIAVGACEGQGSHESISGSCPGGGKCNGTGGSSSCTGCPTFNNQQLRRQQEQQMEGLACANCATTTTPLWRRDDQGNTICNACGLYYKLHNVHRPVSMKRSVIKRRRRLILMGSGGDDHGDGDDDEMIQDDSSETLQRSTNHEQHQQLQRGSPALPKKIRKPYRKRIKATGEDSDQQTKGKRKRQSTVSDQISSSPSRAATTIETNSVLSVPAIEDYIVPKRTGLPSTVEISPSSSPSSRTTMTSSPLNGSHQQSPTYYQQQYYQNHLPTRMGNPPSSLSLPPISSERRSAHFDPFYRDGRAPPPASTSSSASSSSTTANTSLPPISLPSLLRPTAATPSSTVKNNSDMSTLLQDSNTTTTNSIHGILLPPSPNSIGSSSAFTSIGSASEMDQPSEHLQQRCAFMELEDWDEALQNLQLLRKKVQPEHVQTLAQLSKPLWDMVSKAQSIVHGTGALSHP